MLLRRMRGAVLFSLRRLLLLYAAARRSRPTVGRANSAFCCAEYAYDRTTLEGCAG